MLGLGYLRPAGPRFAPRVPGAGARSGPPAPPHRAHRVSPTPPAALRGRELCQDIGRLVRVAERAPGDSRLHRRPCSSSAKGGATGPAAGSWAGSAATERTASARLRHRSSSPIARACPDSNAADSAGSTNPGTCSGCTFSQARGFLERRPRVGVAPPRTQTADHGQRHDAGDRRTGRVTHRQGRDQGLGTAPVAALEAHLGEPHRGVVAARVEVVLGSEGDGVLERCFGHFVAPHLARPRPEVAPPGGDGGGEPVLVGELDAAPEVVLAAAVTVDDP